ncbi:MAG TPA: serine hydrolase domain-containing protein [Pyrinomonadaceae bacterium]|nr:serine hydrolase domain-containing protein [Pyrinomonadaceae bacterium]
MRRLFPALMVCVLFLHVAVAFSQSKKPLSKKQINDVEAILKSETTQGNIPAFSVAIVVGNEVRYLQGFGMADLENSVPAKATTAYRLGSMTKTITATAVMQLAEKGKLDLDKPVQQYCAAFPEKQWPLSTRQLLAHLGGIRDYDNKKFLEEYFSTRHYSNITDSLEIFKNDPLLQEPGTKYSYSTYGYNLLGCVIEGASGVSYAAYISDNILKPAGMTRTRVDDVSEIIPERARGYGKTREGTVVNTRLSDTSNKIPAGGLVSSVEDIGRFAVALFERKLLDEASTQQMWTPQKTRDDKVVPYALGWRVGERNGMKEVFHGGAAAGFSTFLYLLPDKKTAVVLMANLELLGSKQRDDVARKIADLVIE